MVAECREGVFPSHLLYGALELDRHGVETVLHLYPPQPPSRRWLLTWLTTWRICTSRRHFDVVYGTSFRGLEGIILLRALRLFRKPVAIWHHQPVVHSSSKLRECFSRFFYRGIDLMFFFSRPLADASLKSGKVTAEHMQVVHWGADLSFYDRVLQHPMPDVAAFISTGKERRDMPTLIRAFERTRLPLDIHINRRSGDVDYWQILGGMEKPDNVRVHEVDHLAIGELAPVVAGSRCVVICCQPSNYTVGLTTLVEALALGLPVVVSRNETFPFDVDAEGVGMTVDYGDVEGWVRAVSFIHSHPDEAREMGRRGRLLAERLFHVEQTAAEVAKALKAHFLR